MDTYKKSNGVFYLLLTYSCHCIILIFYLETILSCFFFANFGTNFTWLYVELDAVVGNSLSPIINTLRFEYCQCCHWSTTSDCSVKCLLLFSYVCYLPLFIQAVVCSWIINTYLFARVLSFSSGGSRVSTLRSKPYVAPKELIMSLKVLLKCSDEEFERLISLMDVQVMTGRRRDIRL